MNSLTRSSLRTLWLCVSLLLIVASYFIYGMATSTRAGIDQARLDLDAVQRELENAQRISASLAQLDASTLNENTATRLEVLRHLGLEQTDYKVDISGRAEQQVGDTVLYQRTIKITLTLPYGEAMAMIDRFHNEGRMTLTSVVLNANSEDTSKIQLSVEGITFGLQKKGTNV